MNTSRMTAILVGTLFIIGTLAGILSAVVTAPISEAPDFLTRVAANEDRVALGALLVLIMGFALALVPVLMFPIARLVFALANTYWAVGSLDRRQQRRLLQRPKRYRRAVGIA